MGEIAKPGNIEANGRLAQVKLEGENLTITRLGAFGKVKSRLTIRTGAIASIDFKPATKFAPGHLEVHSGQIGENMTQPMFKQDRPSCALFLLDEAGAFHAIASALGVSGLEPLPADAGAPEKAQVRYAQDDSNRLATRKMAWGGAVGFVMVGLIMAFGTSDQQKAELREQHLLPPEEVAEIDRPLREDKPQSGEHCLSGWDGANRDLVRQIKATMRDPGSFEHMNTRIYGNDKGEHGLWMTFRARNGFGGMNVEEVYARIDHDTCKALRFGKEPGV
ncbi:hypothetical protein [Blastomonas sp.]|uniref:hypothetical protein n=1 Tax=Blastomonas sp. TaxID=1909299 RepID=UPI003919221D